MHGVRWFFSEHQRFQVDFEEDTESLGRAAWKGKKKSHHRKRNPRILDFNPPTGTVSIGMIFFP